MDIFRLQRIAAVLRWMALNFAKKVRRDLKRNLEINWYVLAGVKAYGCVAKSFTSSGSTFNGVLVNTCETGNIGQEYLGDHIVYVLRFSANDCVNLTLALNVYITAITLQAIALGAFILNVLCEGRIFKRK